MIEKRLITGLLLGAIMCVFVPSAFATIDSAPSLTVTPLSNGNIKLAWTASDFSGVTNSVTYDVERSLTGDFAGEETVISTGQTDLIFTDTGLANGVKYYYRVVPVADDTGRDTANSAIGSAVKSQTGSTHAWKTKPTFGMSWEKSDQVLVNNGVIWNNQRYDVTDNWWTHFPKQNVNTNEEQNLSMTVYSPKGLAYGAFYLGVPSVGKSNEAQVKVTVTKSGETTLEQKVNLITVTKSKVETVKCNTINNLQCDRITISYFWNEPPKFDVFAFQAVDAKRQETTTYLNEGFKVIGDSINPADELFIVPSDSYHRGAIHVTNVDLSLIHI